MLWEGDGEQDIRGISAGDAASIHVPMAAGNMGQIAIYGPADEQGHSSFVSAHIVRISDLEDLQVSYSSGQTAIPASEVPGPAGVDASWVSEVVPPLYVTQPNNHNVSVLVPSVGGLRSYVVALLGQESWQS